MENNFVFMQLSSLEKVFLDDDISRFKKIDSVTALKNERVSYQILYSGGNQQKNRITYKFNADRRLKITVRNVGNVPSAFPAKANELDEYYLRTKPGLYPDVLYPAENNEIYSVFGSYHSLFVTVEISEDMPKGSYPIEFVFDLGDKNHKEIFTVNVLDYILPKQDITYTQWFHADCIASYYKMDIFCEEHWQMIEKFVKMAVHTGINMILTPVFTLPLDTEVGKERPTLQLVDVYCTDNGYNFGFSKLERWIDMCLKNGIENFEISHLFSQWGTGCTPKIVSSDGAKIFGWHTKADSSEYKAFLNAFLPELIEFLKSKNIYENTYFHVSDEPDFTKDFECYKKEKEILQSFVSSDKIIDAISHYEFCECSLVKKPVVITNSVDEFFKRDYKDIWAYYCCGPCDDGYSNRFMAMPSGRNRITGFQLYKYDIKGFLHWGFNFYYSQLSKREINPFLVTDADEAFQSGDAFSVYPGKNGPYESLRSVVFYEALQDYRACRLLESFIGKEKVDELINEDGEIKFNKYPRTDEGVLKIRSRINKVLENL